MQNHTKWFTFEKINHLKSVSFIIIIVLFGKIVFAQNDSITTNTNYKKFITPAICMATSGILFQNGIYDRFSIQKDLQSNFKNFHTNADFVLQGVPYALGYTMFLLGKKGDNDFLNKGLLLVKSQLLANGITYGLKYTLNVQRPDSSDYHSFPSGHTTRAFAAATWLHLEYGKEYPLLSVLGFTCATSVGILRMMNNEHWISDVLAGAAIGIASTQFVYLTHRYKWGKKISFVPYYLPNNGGLVLLIKP